MKSMTGFASILSKDKKKDFKLKSVNNRFFEFRLHAPSEYLDYETEIRKEVQKTIQRGSVDLFIHKNRKQQDKKSEIVLDSEIAKDFVKKTLKLAKSLKFSPDVQMTDVLRYSGALKSESSQGENINKKSLFLDISSLSRLLEKERKREGEALKKELIDLLDKLEKLRENLVKLAEALPKEIRQGLQEKMQKFKEDVDPQRLNQEILFFIDKSDIKEELVRLKEHIRACKKILNSKDSEGKKLDFYAQELFREMNTVGSKSSSVKITQEVLQGKAIIEKIRQQVQNIE